MRQLTLDAQLFFSVTARFLEAFLAQRHVGQRILNRSTGLADQIFVVDEDLVCTLEGLLCRGKIPLRELHLGEAHQHLLQFDFVFTRNAFANFQRLLPRRASCSELALTEVGPRVGNVDIPQWLAIFSIVAFENGLRELQYRQCLVVLVHVGDQWRRKRTHPPGEFDGLLAVFTRHPRRGCT